MKNLRNNIAIYKIPEYTKSTIFVENVKNKEAFYE